jgi:hypothetical protein
MHHSKIPKDNNDEHINLEEPTGLQKGSVNFTTVEGKRLSKVVLIVDDDQDMTSIFSLGLQDEGFEDIHIMILWMHYQNSDQTSMIYCLWISTCLK